jgi:hypothetical protein
MNDAHDHHPDRAAAPAPDSPVQPEPAVAAATPGDEPDTVAFALSGLIALVGAVLAIILGCGGIAGVVLLPDWTITLVLVAPVLALASAVLAGVTLVRIKNAGGELIGRTPAILGLFVGLGATALLGATVAAGLLTLAGSRQLAPVAADFARAAVTDQNAAAQQLLSEPVRRTIEQQRIDAFAEAVERELGVPVAGRAGPSLIGEARSVMASAPGAATARISPDRQPRPFWLEFDASPAAGSPDPAAPATPPARAFAYGFVNQDALQAREVLLDDLLILTPAPPNSPSAGGERRAIILQPDGPARFVADQLGWEIVNP